MPTPHPHRNAAAGAAECHALCVRLTVPVDAALLAERLGEAAGPLPFWVDGVPAGSGEPAALHRRERELTRPVTEQPGVRAVLLAYADGPADLVLVARRDRVDRSALHDLGRAARGAAVAARPRDPVAPVPSTVAPPAVPDWGLGDRRMDGRWAEFRVPVGSPGDPAGWLAALAVVLSRYEPEAVPVVALPGPPDRIRTVRVTGDTTLGALAGQLREGLDAPADPAPRPAPSVGLAVHLEHSGEDEYVPWLAPSLPITVLVTRTPGGGAELRCRHLLGAVSPAAAERFVHSVAHVHEQLTATPERAVAGTGLTGHQRTTVPPLVSTPRRLPDLFAGRVAAHPDTVALSDGRGRHTYAELDRWSDRLAHGLRAVGVRDGDPVGVCLERSAELVALLLAVLKAGAVYVPLDAAYPADRLAWTVGDAGLTVVVTTSDDFPRAAGVELVAPARLGELGASGTVLPATTGTPADPAYVIYTSGSTGRPKGVVVPHANVVSLLDATRAEFGFGGEDVWTFFHSAAFDFSVWEIWGCLLTGGHLVVVPYWVSRSPEQFHELLAERGVTVLNQTPSGFAQLVEADRTAGRDLAVRLVIFGGEPLDARALLPWLDRHPTSRCRLVNMFGITETTVHVTAGDVTRAVALAGSRSVGRPLPGWSVRVLDVERRPVPPGVPGEIYVGGAGVAIGYLGRPDLTAERFLVDPETGERWYRSGDRGRLLPDGTLEHLGRLDNQVKLRGFRIELDEIRGVLAECPGVAAAAVVVRRADPDDPATARVDAYVVPSGGAAPEVGEHAARMLPDHMRPATITLLSTLPVTPNGKVDLAALPEPVRAAPERAEVPVPAGRDGLAGDLVDVWQQVFGCPVGMSDNFFELGGNSLLAVRMAALMRTRGLPRLHPRTLYLNPTVRALADALHPA